MYDMLEEAETNGHAYIVSWCDGGRAFKIHKPDHMILLLNTYFSQTKYKSFIRQLQTYGFTRYTRGDLEGIVSHPLLIKGKRFLCLRMRRKIRQKKSKPSTKSSTSKKPQETKRVPQTATTGASSDTTSSQANTLSTMEILKTLEQQHNCAKPLPQSGRNLEQDFSSNCVTPRNTSTKVRRDWNGFGIPLSTTTVDSIIDQEATSDSMILNILDDIDDDFCDYFTKIDDDEPANNDLSPSTFSLEIEEDDDEWLKGITYEGSDIILDTEKFDLAFPPSVA
jgi:hypothetical protein